MRINHAEVGAHAHRPGKAAEQLLEIIDRATRLQGLRHNIALAVNPRGVVFGQVVGNGIHYRKAGIVHAHPRLVEGKSVAAVEEADISNLAFLLYAVYEIGRGRGVAMLP